MDYLLTLLVMAGIYAILALSLNLLVGYTGILSLSQGASFGVGAYAAALISTKTEMGIWVELGVAAAALAALGGVLAAGTGRLAGDYFLVASIAIQFALTDAFTNLRGITNGAAGIFGIPQVTIFGISIDSDSSYAVLVWLGVLVVALISWRITSSPVGRVLRALRSDETATRSLGKNVRNHKIAASASSGALAGVAGVVYAHYVSYIDPTTFTISESIFILTIVVIGGSATTMGPILGALILMVGLPELLSQVSLPDDVSAAVNQMVYGLLLICVVRFMPKGVAGALGDLLRRLPGRRGGNDTSDSSPRSDSGRTSALAIAGQASRKDMP